MRSPVVIGLFPLLLLSAAGMPECSQGLVPIATAENRKLDDNFPGHYTQNKKDSTPLTAEEKKTQQQFDVVKDGDGYKISTWAADKPKQKEVYRASIVELAGKRILDATPDVSAAPKLVQEMSVPLHFYLRFDATADGYALFHLDEAWLDAQNAKAPIAVVRVTTGSNDDNDTLSGDPAAVTALLTKALADDKAWVSMNTYTKKKK